MLHHIRLWRNSVDPLIGSPIILLNSKTDNQVFKTHLLALMLEIILEVFPTRWQLLNDRGNLE